MNCRVLPDMGSGGSASLPKTERKGKEHSCSLGPLTAELFKGLKSPDWRVCIFAQGPNRLAYSLTKNYSCAIEKPKVYAYAVPKLVATFEKTLQKTNSDLEKLSDPIIKIAGSRLSLEFSFPRDRFYLDHANQVSPFVLFACEEKSVDSSEEAIEDASTLAFFQGEMQSSERVYLELYQSILNPFAHSIEEGLHLSYVEELSFSLSSREHSQTRALCVFDWIYRCLKACSTWQEKRVLLSFLLPLFSDETRLSPSSKGVYDLLCTYSIQEGAEITIRTALLSDRENTQVEGLLQRAEVLSLFQEDPSRFYLPLLQRGVSPDRWLLEKEAFSQTSAEPTLEAKKRALFSFIHCSAGSSLSNQTPQEEKALEMIADLAAQIDFDNPFSQGDARAIIRLFCEIPKLKLSVRLKNKATCGVIKQLFKPNEQNISHFCLEAMLSLAQAARENHRGHPLRGPSKPWTDLLVDLVINGEALEGVPVEGENSLSSLLKLLSSCIDASAFSGELEQSLEGKNRPLFYLKAFLLLKDPFYLFKLSQHPFAVDLLNRCPKIAEPLAPHFALFYSSANLKNHRANCLNLLSYMESFVEVESCYPHWLAVWKGFDADRSTLESHFLDVLQQRVKGSEACLNAYQSLYQIPALALWLESHSSFALSDSVVAAAKIRMEQLLESDVSRTVALMVKAKEINALKETVESLLAKLCLKHPNALASIASEMEEDLPLLLRSLKEPMQIEALMLYLTAEKLSSFKESTLCDIAEGIAERLFAPPFDSKSSLDFFVEHLSPFLRQEALVQLTFTCANKNGLQPHFLFEAVAGRLTHPISIRSIESADTASDWFSMLLAWSEKNQSLQPEWIEEYAGALLTLFLHSTQADHALFSLLAPRLGANERQQLALKWCQIIESAVALLTEAKKNLKKGQKGLKQAEAIMGTLPVCLFRNHAQLIDHYLSLVQAVCLKQERFPEQATAHLEEIAQSWDWRCEGLIARIVAFLPYMLKMSDLKKVAKHSMQRIISTASDASMDATTLEHLTFLLRWVQEGNALNQEAISALSSALVDPTKQRDPQIYTQILAVLLKAQAIDWIPLIRSMLSRQNIAWADKILVEIAGKDLSYLKEILKAKIKTLIEGESPVQNLKDLALQFYSYLVMINQNKNYLKDSDLICLIATIAKRTADLCQLLQSDEWDDSGAPIKPFTANTIAILMSSSQSEMAFEEIATIYLKGHVDDLIGKRELPDLDIESEISLYFAFMHWAFFYENALGASSDYTKSLMGVQQAILARIWKQNEEKQSDLIKHYANCLQHKFAILFSHKSRLVDMALHFFYRLFSNRSKISPETLSSIFKAEISGLPFPLRVFQSSRANRDFQDFFTHHLAYCTFTLYVKYILSTKEPIDSKMQEMMRDFEEQCWRDNCEFCNRIASSLALNSIDEKQKIAYADQISALILAKFETYFKTEFYHFAFLPIQNEQLLDLLLLLIDLSTKRAKEVLRQIIEKEKKIKPHSEHSYATYLATQKDQLIWRFVLRSADADEINNILNSER